MMFLKGEVMRNQVELMMKSPVFTYTDDSGSSNGFAVADSLQLAQAGRFPEHPFDVRSEEVVEV